MGMGSEPRSFATKTPVAPRHVIYFVHLTKWPLVALPDLGRDERVRGKGTTGRSFDAEPNKCRNAG